jgi:predicted anti-sigma-YlaC factor YlaD
MMRQRPCDCEHYQELLTTPLDELAREEQQALEQHLQTCKACLQFREESEVLLEELKTLPAFEVRTGLSAEVDRQLTASSQEALKTAGQRSRYFMKYLKTVFAKGLSRKKARYTHVMRKRVSNKKTEIKG